MKHKEIINYTSMKQNIILLSVSTMRYAEIAKNALELFYSKWEYIFPFSFLYRAPVSVPKTNINLYLLQEGDFMNVDRSTDWIWDWSSRPDQAPPK
jgi:hypothetical protein